MIKKAELLANGRVVAYFISNAREENTMSGEIYEVYSWEIDTETPIEAHLFTHVSVKADGCSHFNFFGETYKDGIVGHVEHQEGNYDESLPSYYHVCGATYYMQFMRFMQFAYEIMLHITDVDSSIFAMEREDFNKLKQLGLLDGFEIRYMEE